MATHSIKEKEFIFADSFRGPGPWSAGSVAEECVTGNLHDACSQEAEKKGLAREETGM